MILSYVIKLLSRATPRLHGSALSAPVMLERVRRRSGAPVRPPAGAVHPLFHVQRGHEHFRRDALSPRTIDRENDQVGPLDRILGRLLDLDQLFAQVGQDAEQPGTGPRIFRRTERPTRDRDLRAAVAHKIECAHEQGLRSKGAGPPVTIGSGQGPRNGRARGTQQGGSAALVLAPSGIASLTLPSLLPGWIRLARIRIEVVKIPNLAVVRELLVVDQILAGIAGVVQLADDQPLAVREIHDLHPHLITALVRVEIGRAAGVALRTRHLAGGVLFTAGAMGRGAVRGGLTSLGALRLLAFGER